MALYGVFSGSEGDGYEASQFVKQKLAELIFANEVFFTQPTVVLKGALEAVHADLLNGEAGTTATCTAALCIVMRLKTETWVIVGSVGGNVVTLMAKDAGEMIRMTTPTAG